MSKDIRQLKVGAGCGEIVFPQEMFPTDGFCKMHDAPHVRVLLIDGDVRFALVSIELVVVAKPFVIEIKKIINEAAGIDPSNIWVHGIHVISTPHTPGPKHKGPGAKLDPISEEDKVKKQLFTDALFGAARGAAAQAFASLKPASYGFACGACKVNCSGREQESSNGLWSPDDEYMFTVNRVLTAVKFETDAGNPIAILLNYGVVSSALDNTGMSDGTRQVSSDLVGKACSILEEKYGVPVLFFMSAAADQPPRNRAYYKKKDKDGQVVIVDKGVAYGLDLIELLGTELATEAENIIEGITDFSSDTLLRTSRDVFVCRNKEGDRSGETVELDLLTARLGNIGFAASNPEFTGAAELNLYKDSPFHPTIFISMVDGPKNCMADLLSFEEGNHWADRSFARPGEAERLVDAAIGSLKKL